MNREEDGKLTVCVFFIEIETSVFQQSAIMIGIRIMIREGVYPCFFRTYMLSSFIVTCYVGRSMYFICTR